jgi:hypothetical protein
MEDVRDFTLLRSPCRVLHAFFKVAYQSLLSAVVHLSRPQRGLALAFSAALLYLFLYYPPSGLVYHRDLFCTVRASVPALSHPSPHLKNKPKKNPPHFFPSAHPRLRRWGQRLLTG